jgi:hypothetical protein
MLTKSGAEVLDCGLATSEGDDIVSGGRMMGTPAYMAPEQREGERARKHCGALPRNRSGSALAIHGLAGARITGKSKCATATRGAQAASH